MWGYFFTTSSRLCRNSTWLPRNIADVAHNKPHIVRAQHGYVGVFLFVVLIDGDAGVSKYDLEWHKSSSSPKLT